MHGTTISKFMALKLLIGADTVGRRRSDGRYGARWGYFYRDGMTAEIYADRVRAAGGTVITATDNWNAWPKDSYFEVTFTMPDGHPNTAEVKA